jgi:phosphotransferase system  glucose/maltose/N-acetylglucosamine-specific IIC component
MIKNIGLMDKKIRILVSAIVAILAIIFHIWWLLIIPIVGLATVFIGFCPAYTLFKLNTNKSKNKKETKPKSKSKKAKRK